MEICKRNGMSGDGLDYSAFLFASPFTVVASNKNLQNKNGLIRCNFACNCCT
jgi:hypothetical protein